VLVLEERLIGGGGGVSVVVFRWWAWTARLGFDFGGGGDRFGLGDNNSEFGLLICITPPSQLPQFSSTQIFLIFFHGWVQRLSIEREKDCQRNLLKN
jgi:hypothetical protein